MKVEGRSVRSLIITDVPKLDPVHVYFEDVQPKVGRVTIVCWGKAWSGFWSDMGDRLVAEFFCAKSASYLAGCMSDADSTIYDPSGWTELADTRIDEGLASGEFDESEANELKEQFDRDIDEPWAVSSLMEKVFGPEWWRQMPSTSNPDVNYLCRIIEAVRAAFAAESLASNVASSGQPL